MQPLLKLGNKLTYEEDLVMPGSNGDKRTGLETDIPDLEKKINIPLKVKLVSNIP